MHGVSHSNVPINLDAEYKREACELRNKLLMFRFRNFGKCRIDPALVDRSVEPRLAQVFGPLLSIIDDQSARQSLRELMRQYDRELVTDRGMEIEAEVLDVIRELHLNPQFFLKRRLFSKLGCSERRARTSTSPK